MFEANCAAAVHFLPHLFHTLTLLLIVHCIHSFPPTAARYIKNATTLLPPTSTLRPNFNSIAKSPIPTHDHHTNPHPACQSGPPNPSKPLRPFLPHQSTYTLALGSDTLYAQILPSHTKHPTTHLHRKRYMQRMIQVLHRHAIYVCCIRHHGPQARWGKIRAGYTR
jgi:hypothetical protein